MEGNCFQVVKKNIYSFVNSLRFPKNQEIIKFRPEHLRFAADDAKKNKNNVSKYETRTGYFIKDPG